MVINQDIENKFQSWLPWFKPFIESEQFDAVFRQLKADSKEKGKTILPASKDLFRIFTAVPRDKVQCIMMFMDPYPALRNKVPIANGIALDCSNTNYMQPSLWRFMEKIEQIENTELNPDMDYSCSLEYLTDQGVMLINSALSVQEGCVGSHKLLWRPFMEEFWKIINENYKGLPIVLSGADSQYYEKSINPLLHYILKCEHPSFANRENRQWRHMDCFNFINNILESNNGPEHRIEWMKKRALRKAENAYPEWITHKSDGTPYDEVSDLPWNTEPTKQQ